MKRHLLKTICILFLSVGILQACGNAEKAVSEDEMAEAGIETKLETADANAVENQASDIKLTEAEENSAKEDESRNQNSEAEILHFNSESEILYESQLLFAGNTNQEYASSSCKDVLKKASPSDRVAVYYACDDPEHGGWGILGIMVSGANKINRQIEINAATDDPGKERLAVYTVQELMDLVEISDPSDFSGFNIGAWNGGRIAGLYYLNSEISKAYEVFVNERTEMFMKSHTYDGSLSNKNASENTTKLYEYLKSIYGNGCITGQMESTWMGSPDYEMNYIFEKTGKYPAIRGLDFMSNDFEGVTKRAKEWWSKGGIVTICWHTGADFASSYNECKDDNINWNEAFTEGSDTYNQLISGMDRAAKYLKELDDAGVPVLWRPFHEFDGGWFWWSKGGGENFVKLWQMMYDRYTNYWGINNLIWVLGYSNAGQELTNWYPGDEYVDIIGGDSYTDGANNDLYERVAAVAAEDMPITFHECGKIPTADELQKDNTNWLYFMTWHTEYLTDANSDELLKEIYTGDFFITLDELQGRF